MHYNLIPVSVRWQDYAVPHCITTHFLSSKTLSSSRTAADTFAQRVLFKEIKDDQGTCITELTVLYGTFHHYSIYSYEQTNGRQLDTNSQASGDSYAAHLEVHLISPNQVLGREVIVHLIGQVPTSLSLW
jgi:hypothetical protein